jgi:hypothetical protein
MSSKHAVLALALVPVLWFAPADAGARRISLRLKYSGSAMSTHRDPNRDGIRAGFGLTQCRSNLGRCTTQGIGEAIVAGPAVCPNGNSGVNLTLVPGTGHGITRFETTGDLLFGEILSETVCFDPATNTQFKTGTSRITGGTGRFAGATGETTFEGTQWPLYVDANGDGFAAQIGTVTGTIELPDD